METEDAFNVKSEVLTPTEQIAQMEYYRKNYFNSHAAIATVFGILVIINLTRNFGLVGFAFCIAALVSFYATSFTPLYIAMYIAGYISFIFTESIGGVIFITIGYTLGIFCLVMAKRQEKLIDDYKSLLSTTHPS